MEYKESLESGYCVVDEDGKVIEEGIFGENGKQIKKFENGVEVKSIPEDKEPENEE